MTTHIHLSGATSLLGFIGLGVALYSLSQRGQPFGEPAMQPSAAPPPPPQPRQPLPDVLRLAPPVPLDMVDTIPSHAVQVTDSPPPSSAIPATASPVQRSAPDAAKALYAYITPLIRAGKTGTELGTTDQPNNFIANAQRDMRIVRSDGIYGPKTAARGKELLGREFPARSSTKKRVQPAPQQVDIGPAVIKEATISPLEAVTKMPPEPGPAAPPPPAAPAAPPPPSVQVNEHAPQEAAAALYALVTHKPVDWGSKQKPNELIRGAQADMGGLVSDGIYGPKTRDRGTKLLGKSFPARK